ncbi:hypothetical protein SODALDRAFT_193966 [Sodiomyces alkalinus F11]|uniref:CAP-Gly domain-containing protein n=1 Tax=Sodiomyces alkalinus (strain CBS 110278 / VKM F-3762 / F11) TaxID=1314773 RepID=A0A3N2PSK3_SODAK|nr:hypothetical protein SODALDRAFT_193966 [Sodiomyces alkalinus F11]ROT37306.1 hypothetical protein SODALDRAFT_193966 [Sodiomyces alkalinus F11]
MSSTLTETTSPPPAPPPPPPSTTTSTTTKNLLPPGRIRSQLAQPPRQLRKVSSFSNINVASHAASSPNLNSLYSAHARLAPPPPPSALARKGSLAALTQSSLAAIPDVSETYGIESVLTESPSPEKSKMVPTTPGRSPGPGLGEDLAVGDAVDVPGNMHGTVRFVGSVHGKKGVFAGIELHPDFAVRGKNSGDVDGMSYFTTNIPGAGIFVPVAKALRRDSPPNSVSTTYPLTPTTTSFGGLRVGTQNSTNHAPPTPSLPKFSQSVGPGTGPPRAPSPQTKRSRPSLPRPESPIRRLAMTPGPRPSLGATPASKVPSRYGTPPPNRFAQSVRGTAGDPSKRTLERQPSIGPRSASALGQASNFGDEEFGSTTTMQPPPKTNGSVGSISSFNSRFRPASRANNDEEMERLRAQLEDRDRQLREQSATLSEMESSLTELQTLMENPEALVLRPRRNSLDDKDSMQLRAILREKNEKIAMLTAEFDAHRADFRSTIDTLEMASTETERVYEKRIEELQQEIRELESRTEDVDSVARQLKQLEELVQELEEGLEDARRGEAEARGEVEFLRGEVERTRAELRREREKASGGGGGGAGGQKDGQEGMVSSKKELEQKEDEIRGLKAIIHSLSRDSVPGGGGETVVERSHPPRSSSFVKTHSASDSMDAQAIRDKMEREMSELRAMLDDKSHREEELERELEVLRRTSMQPKAGAQRSSLRDSRDTVVLARNRDARSSPEVLKRASRPLDPMAESDAYSTATENSTLWCEICETAGHDVLSCTQMFGDGAKSNNNNNTNNEKEKENDNDNDGVTAATTRRAGTIGPFGKGGQDPFSRQHDVKPAPLSPAKTKTPLATPRASAAPNPLDSGPVAGKASGVVDDSKWCALCERDGHDSVDCPFEDAF